MTTSETSYDGYWINLDRDLKRREALSTHLEARGVADRYQRFAAVDGRAVAAEYPSKLSPGELGLWLTHLKLLESVGTPGRHIHILEDDAFLCRNASSMFDQLLRHADRQLPGWDLLFTDGLFVPDLELMRQLIANTKEGGVTFIDLARIPWGCTDSFFISRASVEKYGRLIGDAWSASTPIDLYLHRLAKNGELKAYTTMPFLTTISADASASGIRGAPTRSFRVLDQLRRALFIEAELRTLSTELLEMTRGIQHPPIATVYMLAVNFILSDQFS